MGYRNIFIQNPAKISVKNNQLVVKNETEHSVPLEDISSVMIENNQCIITAAALSMLGQSGCTVFVCDAKHLPCAVLEPFMQHSRSFKVYKAQISASEPFNKQLWKTIVQEKIKNQARCLQYSGNENDANYLMMLSEKVQSGDKMNTEAVAAAKYFPALFGEGFTRESDEFIQNSFLNYGYAVLRGSIARCISSYGLLPELGIHHKSELNSFNLADDLIEPFRPAIDCYVSSKLREKNEMNTDIKSQLYNVLNSEMIIEKKKYPVSFAIELTVQSLVKSYKEGQNRLVLPELLDYRIHRYE